jgi:hypothetical protein
MKRNIAVGGLIAIGLAGCSPSTPDPSTLSVVNSALATAAGGCKFLPTVETVLSLMSAVNPTVAGGEAIGEAICKALPPAPAKGTAAFPRGPVVVEGVQIKGQYLFFR